MPPLGSKFYSARILERRDLSGDLWVIRSIRAGNSRIERASMQL